MDILVSCGVGFFVGFVIFFRLGYTLGRIEGVRNWIRKNRHKR